ncbi:MAG: UDP-N-acetylmuramoyl-L-alanyl-D-glutamate--2,6-diaminopimelate ligase [Clostridia bacterium]|nr:UDP-N-acetylmuramoyl-L-alanyl-D-glutamate--2,6-diaminopimelate ligase [Clostridia bacterium]
MLLSELIRVIPVQETAVPDIEIGRIEYNSRKADADCLFVCLVGARADGHDYAMHAYRNGCRAFLVSKEIDLPADAITVTTEDTRAALSALSAAFYGYPAEKLTLIGVTGTKGKTTTSLLISAILNGAGLPCAYIGGNGVIWNGHRIETVNTTPESRDLHGFFAQMVRDGIRYVAMEVSSQALAHHRVDGLTFDTVVFTNLSPDHIGEGEHPTFEHYAASKARLFTKHGAKHAVYNADDPQWHDILGNCKSAKISCGIFTEADFTAAEIAPYRDRTTLGIRFDAKTPGGSGKITVCSPGTFSVQNALEAIAVASVYGVSVASCARVLAKTPVLGRFEIVEGIPGRTFIIDYAHNGMSLSHALTALREYAPNRLICVFGSVGGRTQERRRELGEAASALADFCIVTSDNPDFEDPNAIIAEILSHMHPDCPRIAYADRETAIRHAVRMSEDGDIVLFAGKGHETFQLIEGRKVPFSEREIILNECAILLDEIE